MSRALIYAGPRKAVIEEGPEAAGPVADGNVRARMVVSALSRGTERLVFEGRVPPSEHARMRAPFQRGDFPFPVEYGYCAVAEVLEGPEALLGRLIFALHPHRTLFRLPAAACAPLPDGLSPDVAALAANMETALNVVWDARIGPGDRVAVIGAGLVGCLIAHLAAGLPGTQVHLADENPSRKQTAEQLGVRFCNTSDLPEGLDVSINASASAAGLAAAEAAVRDTEWVIKCRAENMFWRDWLATELRGLGLEVDAPQANFVLPRCASAAQAQAADARLRAHGIIVRPVGGYGLPEFLRITVGDEVACRRVVAILRGFLEAAA